MTSNPRKNRILKVPSLSGRIMPVLLLVVLTFGRAFATPSSGLPPEAGFVLQKAYGLLEKKEIAQAIDVLKTFREQGLKNPASADAGVKGTTHYLIDFTLGNCYLMAGQPENACRLYESAVEKNPQFDPAWINLAKCNYDLGRYEKAGKSFLQGYEAAENKKPDILYYAAVAFLAADLPQRAAGVFDRLVSRHPDAMTLEWKESAVQAFLPAGRPEKALPLMEDLAEKTSGEKRRPYQEALFYQYLNMNMEQQAITFANRLIREYPVDPKWWKALAHLHLSADRYQDGLVSLTVYGLMTPLTDPEKKLMAELNAAVGIPIQAARFYEAILSQKMDTEILVHVAEAYMQSNRFQEALVWIEKGLQHAPESFLLMLKGNILYTMKAYREAIDVFGSIPEGKSSGQAALMMGYAAWNAGDFERARLAFEKASAYPEQKKAAKKLLDQLKDSMDQEGSE